MDPSASEEAFAHLTRLSQKPGVQATLILSRETGAIVRANGLVSTRDDANANATLPAPAADSTETQANGTGQTEKGAQTAEDVARLVWNFVSAAGTLVTGLDGSEGEVRLLRVRTRKNELVIVPDPKYLLVVVHDTPPA